jgi:hypothetical protein
MRYSPHINQNFLQSDLADRVFHKQFTNGSEMVFTYACDDAERLRGPSTDHNCYDRDAQVLTREGWVHVYEVTREDEIADVNNSGEVEWNTPSDIIVKKYSGKMVTFTHRGFHLRVTGDHNVWVNYHLKSNSVCKRPDQYEFVSALDAAQTSRMGFKMTCQASWKKIAPRFRKFKGVAVRKRRCCERLRLPYKAFARLVGWYIAEGSTRQQRYSTWGFAISAVIAQKTEKGLSDILRCVKDCNLPYYDNKNKVTGVHHIVIHSETLGRYFYVLGKSRNKYIPREFFEYPSLLLEVLKGIYAGDASYHKGEAWDKGTLRTRSKRLAEDVQEAWLRLGRPAPIHVRSMADEPLYEIRPRKRDYFIFWRWEAAKKKRFTIEEVVDEEVYCFTVKNHRPLVKGNFKSLPCISSQCFDEVQDMLYDPVVLVGNETLSESDYGYQTFAGTPKTMENTIQYLWELSTQSEWVMKCSSCGKYVYIDHEKAVGKTGPICTCGAYLNPYTGQWIDLYPERTMHGYHISQLIMPRNVPLAMANRTKKEQEQADMRWSRILTKYEESPLPVFRNEVLGVSDEIGTRLLSKEELAALCVGRSFDEYARDRNFRGCTNVIAGVDWSGGGVGGFSRTVLWIWGYRPSDTKLVTLLVKILPGTNPVRSTEEIIQTCKQYGVHFIVGDAGEGALANDLLRKGLGMHIVTQIQYGSQAHALKFNGVDRYLGDRTTLIDNYFMLLKNQRVEFGPLKEMKVAMEDILNEYEEVTHTGKKVWRHSPQKPDDCLHAGLFGWIAWKILNHDLRFWQE